MSIASWLSSFVRLSGMDFHREARLCVARFNAVRRRQRSLAAVEFLEDRTLLTPPMAGSDSYMTTHDHALTVYASGILMNDMAMGHFDPVTMQYTPPGTLSANLVTSPAHGSLSLNSNGSFGYTPAAGYAGTDSFTYKAWDGWEFSNIATVSINVMNSAPSAGSDTYTTQHDHVLSASTPGVLMNDYDMDGDVMTASVVSSTSHGSLSFNSNGSFTYTPNAGYAGSDSFTYKVSDGVVFSNTATVSINVMNSAPSAGSDTYTTQHDHILSVSMPGVLMNDTDMDGDAMAATVVSTTSHGSLSLSSNGSFTYAPNAGYAGSDSFTYKVSDGVAFSNTATVSINVMNSAPSAGSDTYATQHDHVLTVSMPGVLMNDYDMDGDVITATVVSSTSHGSLSFNSDGSFTYTPNAGYAGSDSFTYKVSDGVVFSNTATVSISVTNSAPTAGSDTYTTQHDHILTVSMPGVLMNDYDMDGDVITPTVVSSTSHGSLSFNSDGSFIYTPNAGYAGSDNFTYKVSDGVVFSNTATVSISVTNSAPTAGSDTYTTQHDHVLTVSMPGVLMNDYDMDGDVMTPTVVSSTSHGSLSFNSDGSFTYTPNAGYAGSDSFTYKVSDGVVDSNTATVSISVTNNAPYAGNDTYTIPHDQVLTVVAPGVLMSDYDMDGDVITPSVVATTTHGALSFNSNGSFVYTPNPGYAGSDSFTYKVSDGVTDSNIATVSLSVTNVGPVAMDDTFEYPDPGVAYIDIDVLANDYDMDDPYPYLQLQSVSSPSDGGTATIVGNKIRFYPPADYYSNSDPTIDVFSVGTQFTYVVVDRCGAFFQADVKGDVKKWTPTREYSRGNDDPAELIYETAKIKVELVIDDTTKKVTLKYTATATTGSRLRTGANGAPEIVRPGDANQGVPEFEYFKDYLFLQTASHGVGTAVPGAGDGVNLTFTAGGVGGTLSAELELATWNNADVSGTAVIQMQIPKQNGGAGKEYYLVRQEIPWSVKIVNNAGKFESKEATLSLTEVALPANQGRVPAPIRIVNSSNKEGEVYKLPYPTKANGLARKADNPATPQDERADPATPPADWNTKVKAKDK